MRHRFRVKPGTVSIHGLFLEIGGVFDLNPTAPASIKILLTASMASVVVVTVNAVQSFMVASFKRVL